MSHGVKKYARGEERSSGHLLLASLLLPSARQLAAVAGEDGWLTSALDETLPPTVVEPCTFYGGTDKAACSAARYGLCLMEPPLDLLAKLPYDLLFRRVAAGAFATVRDMPGPVFVKPADPINKCFDAGVYPAVDAIGYRRVIPEQTVILVSDLVEWTSEFRRPLHPLHRRRARKRNRRQSPPA